MPNLVVTGSWLLVHKNRAVKLFFSIIYVLSSAFVVSPVYAQGLTREECFQEGIAKLGCLPFYLGNVINGLFALSGVAAVILIIISGIRLLLSGGDATAVAKAKTSLFYSIVGFIIVLASFLILRVIAFVTGAECINALGFNTCS